MQRSGCGPFLEIGSAGGTTDVSKSAEGDSLWWLAPSCLILSIYPELVEWAGGEAGTLVAQIWTIVLRYEAMTLSNNIVIAPWVQTWRLYYSRLQGNPSPVYNISLLPHFHWQHPSPHWCSLPQPVWRVACQEQRVIQHQCWTREHHCAHCKSKRLWVLSTIALNRATLNGHNFS